MIRLQRAPFWRWAPHPYRWNRGFHWLGLVVLWNGRTVLRADGNQRSREASAGPLPPKSGGGLAS